MRKLNISVCPLTVCYQNIDKLAKRLCDGIDIWHRQINLGELRFVDKCWIHLSNNNQITICDATNAEKNNSAIWQKIVAASKARLVRNIFISTKGIVWECDPVDKNTNLLLTKRKSNY